MDTVSALLREAELVGLTVRADGKQLHVSGPQTEAGLVERLRQRKADVLAYLQQHHDRERSRANLRFLTAEAPRNDRQSYLSHEREALRAWLQGG